MTPFEWGMLILSSLSTANALAGTDVEVETPALPGGGETTNVAPLPPTNKVPGLPEDIPDLTGPTKELAKIKPLPPQIEQPPKLSGPPRSRAGAASKVEAPAEPPDIGKILAAIGPALEAVVPLLGLNDQRIPEKRPAPISGSGSGGGLVPQFAQTFGNQKIDIGQLLAALPGIRG